MPGRSPSPGSCPGILASQDMPGYIITCSELGSSKDMNTLSMAALPENNPNLMKLADWLNRPLNGCLPSDFCRVVQNPINLTKGWREC